jgi:hypothetical protein
MTWKVHIAKKREGNGYKNLKKCTGFLEKKVIPFLRKQVAPL